MNPGHSMPSGGTSFIDSPVPTPRKIRPGAKQPRVANAWATIDGWKRIVGVLTLVPIRIRSLPAASAPSHGNAAGEWPPVCRNGWK